ncbi:Rv3235 family protein [Bifidobacterium sp. ESL0784]|uniref:Rv3235 family protein n=1 Tax=Bifidobacterium sp. ESL0784 TaxID=2983231 RepID=UPI0023F6895F|nr:Rv3235 family protein [Bifidobacterium sp. ESL0784]MDF7640887.1 Rv3235 family protein [Bifidobacterium sp. ESL0784]
MMNMQMQEQPQKMTFGHRSGLPTYDGFIRIELSNRPVPYHISRCYPGTLSEAECQKFSLASCRLACMCLDMIRGRTPPQSLQHILSGPCLQRLETMSYLLQNHLRTHQELKEKLCYLPAVPMLVYTTLVSPDITETVLRLAVGKSTYWVTLVFKRSGSRWICTTADLG